VKTKRGDSLRFLLYQTVNDAKRRSANSRNRLLAQQAARDHDDAPADLSTPPNTGSRPSRNRTRLITLVSLVALVAVSSTAIFVAQRMFTSGDKGSTPTASGVVAINTKEGDLSCIRDVAWSSNGTQLAALGYQRACTRNEAAAYDYHAGRLNVYASTRGKLAYQLQLDVAIGSALGLKAPVNVTPDPNAPGRGDTSQRIIDYTHVAWRPGTSQLIVTFNVYPVISPSPSPSQGNGSQTMSGVLLTDLTGSQTKVLAHTLGKNEVYSGLWDMTSGAYQSSASSFPPDTVVWFASPPLTPPSLTYQWESSGNLVAQTPIPVATAPAIGAIGNPSGGASFSIGRRVVFHLAARQGGTESDRDQPDSPPPRSLYFLDRICSDVTRWPIPASGRAGIGMASCGIRTDRPRRQCARGS
jgi:hypothetical protein